MRALKWITSTVASIIGFFVVALVGMVAAAFAAMLQFFILGIGVVVFIALVIHEWWVDHHSHRDR